MKDHQKDDLYPWAVVVVGTTKLYPFNYHTQQRGPEVPFDFNVEDSFKQAHKQAEDWIRKGQAMATLPFSQADFATFIGELREGLNELQRRATAIEIQLSDFASVCHCLPAERDVFAETDAAFATARSEPISLDDL